MCPAAGLPTVTFTLLWNVVAAARPGLVWARWRRAACLMTRACPLLVEQLQRGRHQRGSTCGWDERGRALRRASGDRRRPQDAGYLRRLRWLRQGQGESPRRPEARDTVSAPREARPLVLQNICRPGSCDAVMTAGFHFRGNFCLRILSRIRVWAFKLSPACGMFSSSLKRPWVMVVMVTSWAFVRSAWGPAGRAHGLCCAEPSVRWDPSHALAPSRGFRIHTYQLVLAFL